MPTQQAFLIPQIKVEDGSVWYLMHFDFSAETIYSWEQFKHMYSNVIVWYCMSQCIQLVKCQQ